MKTNPVISVVIPTLNSGSTLETTIKSINKQSFPTTQTEIIIIDGGSQDNTLQLARKYNCRVLKNSKVDLVYGKHIGYARARGKYLVFLDSDESLEQQESLKMRIEVFRNNKNVIAVIPSGYKKPPKTHGINDYINEFGDPFSYYLYRDSKGEKYLLSDLKKKHVVIEESENCAVLEFNESKLPLIELWAGGCMIDLIYTKKNFPQIKKKPHLIAHLFYLILGKHGSLAVMKNDATIHYSVTSIKKYKRKLLSRIRNNIFETEMGHSGFAGRSKMVKVVYRKKYMFLFYSFSIVLPVIDAIHLAFTRKKTIYLIHPYLCLYTSIYILYFYVIKKLGIKTTLKNYGS